LISPMVVEVVFSISQSAWSYLRRPLKYISADTESLRAIPTHMDPE
jgi:hypothetical protein